MMKLFLSAKGAISRNQYWIGVIGLAALVLVYNQLIRTLGPETMATFWIIVIGLPLIFYMITCVYCKRLTDMGRTRWIFTGAIALQFLVIIALMLTFGGAEYFEGFAQYDRKSDIDPVVQQEIIRTYQDRQEANMHIIQPAMLIVPVLLTLWLGIAKSARRA